MKNRNILSKGNNKRITHSELEINDDDVDLAKKEGPFYQREADGPISRQASHAAAGLVLHAIVNPAPYIEKDRLLQELEDESPGGLIGRVQNLPTSWLEVVKEYHALEGFIGSYSSLAAIENPTEEDLIHYRDLPAQAALAFRQTQEKSEFAKLARMQVDQALAYIGEKTGLDLLAE